MSESNDTQRVGKAILRLGKKPRTDHGENMVGGKPDYKCKGYTFYMGEKKEEKVSGRDGDDGDFVPEEELDLWYSSIGHSFPDDSDSDSDLDLEDIQWQRETREYLREIFSTPFAILPNGKIVTF